MTDELRESPRVIKFKPPASTHPPVAGATQDWIGVMRTLLASPATKFIRLSWPTSGDYITVMNDQLCLYKGEPKTWHTLIVSLSDMQGTDWIKVE